MHITSELSSAVPNGKTATAALFSLTLGVVGLLVLPANAQTTGATSGARCTVTTLSSPSAGGYQFLNFDGPLAGTNAGAGTNMNGISNTGDAVGFTINNTGAFANFLSNPRKPGICTTLNINGSTQQWHWEPIS